MTFSIETEDVWGTVEGAEHERDPAVLEEVRRGLVAAAGEIEIRYFGGREDAEAVTAFGRAIDMTVGFERGGSNEKHFLVFDKGAVLVEDRVGESGHGG